MPGYAIRRADGFKRVFIKMALGVSGVRREYQFGVTDRPENVGGPRYSFLTVDAEAAVDLADVADSGTGSLSSDGSSATFDLVTPHDGSVLRMIACPAQAVRLTHANTH